MIEKTLNTAKGLLERDEESVKNLTEALIIVGIMMSFAGSSRPASGSEHHLSHFFEIAAAPAARIEVSSSIMSTL